MIVYVDSRENKTKHCLDHQKQLFEKQIYCCVAIILLLMSITRRSLKE